MLNIAPTSIFPLKYPKTDGSLPAHGAKVVPVTIDFMGDNACTVNLMSVQLEKDFESLRCVWIDTRDSTQDVSVEVYGTGQRFIVPKSSAGYYPIIVLNNPQIFFSITNKSTDSVRVLFLNFVPYYSLQSGTSGALPSTVSVDNFPLIQDISGNVAISNFPATVPVFNSSLISASTLHNVYAPPSSVAICGISVTVMAAAAASLSSNVIFRDGSGAFMFAIPITLPSTVNQIYYNVLSLSNYYIPLNNAGAQPYWNLSVALTSGSIAVTVQYK